MVDDHHGTASMTVDATTQAVTRRYTKPFGETRGATPSAWPDDKGFLGKPADADTGLTHIGAREYDPSTGRFLSVDPILAPDDHESLNGYAYANNTPVTKSDPTGLRPDGACGGASSSCNGGTETWTKTTNGWDWSYTKTYTQTGNYNGVNGTLTAVVTQTRNSTTSKITFKKGPEPAPVKMTGNGDQRASASKVAQEAETKKPWYKKLADKYLPTGTGGCATVSLSAGISVGTSVCLVGLFGGPPEDEEMGITVTPSIGLGGIEANVGGDIVYTNADSFDQLAAWAGQIDGNVGEVAQLHGSVATGGAHNSHGGLVYTTQVGGGVGVNWIPPIVPANVSGGVGYTFIPFQW